MSINATRGNWALFISKDADAWSEGFSAEETGMGNKKAMKTVEKRKRLETPRGGEDSADLKSYLIASLKNLIDQASFQLCTPKAARNFFL